MRSSACGAHAAKQRADASRASRSASPPSRCSRPSGSTSPTTEPSSKTRSSMRGRRAGRCAGNNARVEVELSFILRLTAGPGSGLRRGRRASTAADILAATTCVLPSLEILDCHFVEDGMTVVDTISDNAALGAVVRGAEEFDPAAFDLSWIGAKLFHQRLDRGDRRVRSRTGPSRGQRGLDGEPLSQNGGRRSPPGRSCCPGPSRGPCR